ncbi:TPA: conjugal transfer protein TraN [Escherichia coli]|nr:conjugal transfer protein TraN [Escherichia coli]
MKHRKIISSAIIASMIANTMSWAFYVSLINIALTPKIFAADAIFDQLENNFNLANPNANRNATTSAQDIVEKYKNADSGENLSGKISEKYVGKAESTNLNVGKYGTPNSNESVMSNAVSDGKSIGKAVQLPSMSGGTINSNYTKEGAKLLSRDSSGNIGISNNPNTTAGTKTSTGELFSSEQKHSDVQFNAGGRYGDENGFINDIKNRKSQLFEAQSYDGVAYRTLVNANKENPASTIKPNDPMFNAGRNEIGNAVAGNLGRTVGSSAAGESGQLAKETMSSFGLGKLKQMAMEKAYDLLPDTVRDFVFKNVATTGGEIVFSAAVQNFMLALNVIGWIYTAYQVTKMLLEMLVACDQKEMEASIHKNQKSCFTLDTNRCVKYLNLGFTKKCVKKATDMCCYNSMLSRVIMQQAYPQLGIDPVTSNCVGLSIGQIQKLDFDKIDLTEWINDAVQVGEVPDQYATFSESSITANLPFKNENYQLPSERTKDAIGGEENMIKARQENAQAIKEENVDCSYLPRPAICEVGSTYVDPITGKEIPKY